MDERDLRISRALRGIMDRVEKVVEDEAGEPCLIGLVVMPWSRDGSCEVAEFQYISNGDRKFMHGALKSLVQKWDSGVPSIPPHAKQ